MKHKPARHRRVQRRQSMVIFVTNGGGAILTTIYFRLLFWYETPQVQPQVDLPQAGDILVPIVMTIALLLLGWGISQRYLRPVLDWHRRLTTQEESEAVPLPVQRLALNLPVISAATNLTMWVLAGLIMSGWESGLLTNQPDWSAFFQLWLAISGVSGTVTSILVYFALERIWRSEIPLFFPDKDPSHIPAFRVTLRRRLLVLLVLGTVPLLLLAVAAYNYAALLVDAPQPALFLPGLLRVEAFLVGIGLLLAVILAFTLGTSLVEPVEVLGRHMAAVREGNLEVQVPVTSNDELGMLAAGFNAMIAGLRQEKVIRRIFGLYVTPEVADYAIQHGVELGGQLTEATVMFVDIRGFTSIAEKMAPNVVIVLLNRYFQAISSIVVEHGGLVNKMGGDSILAIFGSPLNPAENHAQQAVQAACALLPALEEFNRNQDRRGEPTLRIGVGLATGPVLAGNVGSQERLEYTVIGDTVNMASRLDALTKELEATILLNEATAMAVQDWAPLQQIGQVQVRGREEPVRIYAVRPERWGDDVENERLVV